jgi:hypothetical protein
MGGSFHGGSVLDGRLGAVYDAFSSTQHESSEIFYEIRFDMAEVVVSARALIDNG